MDTVSISPIGDQDRPWIARFTEEHWGADLMVAHGMRLYISQQEGFVAHLAGQVVGLVTYRITGNECEITSLDSLQEGLGVGTRLIDAVKEASRRAGCSRLFLITTNDNTHALRFYQRRGFRLFALYRNAVEESRKIKPEIPFVGNDGIPIRDEIELEYNLSWDFDTQSL